MSLRIFLGPPTQGECMVLVAWHIDKSTFGTINLDGLNIVLAAHSPGHMLQVKWLFIWTIGPHKSSGTPS
jgi:hypothetical protein